MHKSLESSIFHLARGLIISSLIAPEVCSLATVEADSSIAKNMATMLFTERASDKFLRAEALSNLAMEIL